jgi:NhaA family Na+:H+ antiporter
MRPSAITRFLQLQSAGGILLVFAAIIAMVLANSGGGPTYKAFLSIPIGIRFDALEIAKPLLLWINDGLMAVFFLLVALEIKREMLEGELNSLAKALLPGIAAIGGMVVPAAVYIALNADAPQTLIGWAIPSATDIAFALGVLALVPGIPASLRIFLLALAIMDDFGAIVIIALFYSGELSNQALAVATVALLGLVLLNRFRVGRLAPYVLLGIVLWVAVLKSGVHATLAGVALGFALPLAKHGGRSLLRKVEHELHPWVTFAILPLFAFANAGVDLSGFSAGALLDPVTLGIALGLFAGKQAGVMGFAWAAVRLRLVSLPVDATSMQFYGVAILTGIGFTMSLFIGSLAFTDPMHGGEVKIGVILGSLASALAGFLVLRLTKPLRPATHMAAGQPT